VGLQEVLTLSRYYITNTNDREIIRDYGSSEGDELLYNRLLEPLARWHLLPPDVNGGC
jgi:hypothetical protein